MLARFCFIPSGELALAAGGSPAAGDFLLLAQKKVHQRKRRPGSPPAIAGDPAILDESGACATCPRQNKKRGAGFGQCSATAPDPSACLGGSQGMTGTRSSTLRSFGGLNEGKQIWFPRPFTPPARDSHARCFPAPPCDSPRSAGKSGDVGEDCLRPHAIFVRPSSAAARLVEHRRAAGGRIAWGGLFLVTSFGRVYRPGT